MTAPVVVQFESPKFRVQPLGCCFKVQLKLEILKRERRRITTSISHSICRSSNAGRLPVNYTSSARSEGFTVSSSISAASRSQNVLACTLRFSFPQNFGARCLPDVAQACTYPRGLERRRTKLRSSKKQIHFDDDTLSFTFCASPMVNDWLVCGLGLQI